MITDVPLDVDERTWIDDQLERHGQNWLVGTEPLTFEGRDSDEFFWTFRRFPDGSREEIAPVGAKYQPLQNREAFDFINQLHPAGNLIFEQFKSYRGGRALFMEARLPDSLEIAGEPFTDRIIWFNGHDGHLSTGALFSPTRDFCTNACVYLLGRNEPSNNFKIKHTLNSRQRLAVAIQAMQKAKPYTLRLKEIGDQLASERFNARQVDSVLRKIIPNPKDGNPTKAENRRAEIKDVWVTSDNLGNIRRTKWGFLQALTEWNDHSRNYASDDVRFDAVFRGRTLYRAALDNLR